LSKNFHGSFSPYDKIRLFRKWIRGAVCLAAQANRKNRGSGLFDRGLARAASSLLIDTANQLASNGWGGTGDHRATVSCHHPVLHSLYLRATSSAIGVPSFARRKGIRVRRKIRLRKTDRLDSGVRMM
jgi:hypothetical protein